MDILIQAPPIPVASIISAFLLSNFAGQVIVVTLFAVSILAWSLLLTKAMELADAKRATARFLAAYRREPHPAAVYLRRLRFEPSPVYRVYENACAALSRTLGAQDGTGDLFAGAVDGASARRVDEIQLNSVRNAMERTAADQALLLERSMGFVAVATTSAPLLGLLGTVWGAMDAFEKAVGSGSAMLSAVAPGIAGALLTTVVGLLVAIPSGIGYNLLTDKIRRLCVEMDNFAQELMTSIEHHYLDRVRK